MFSLEKTRLKLKNVNCKPELHGQDHVFPLIFPISYGWEGSGYHATVEYGATGNDIELSDVGVDNFGFEMSDGGTVTVKFRLVFKTDALNNGRLIDMQQQEIILTLEPPSAEEQHQAELKRLQGAEDEE